MINESFQPLMSTDAVQSPAQSSRLVILSQPTSARRFTPSAEAVPVSHPSAPTAPVPSATRLAVHRDGDRIKVIEVRCACGEVHQIECDY